MIRRPRLHATLLRGVLPALLLALATASASAGATYRVGADDDCDADTLPQALLLTAVNAGHDVIRVARNQAYTGQAIVISNQSVTIQGGFDDCLDDTSSGSTNLDGAGGSAAPVVTVSNTTGSTTLVDLMHLDLRGGETGGLRVNGQVLVQVFDLLITDNDADEGAGIALDGADGGAVVLDDETRVHGNRAVFDGGGIHCTGPGTVGSMASIRDNDADFNGGGVAATDGCVVNLFRSSFPGSTLRDNDAGFHGGAVHVTGGADVQLIGDANEPLEVRSNRALFGYGGGIYASDAGTTVTLTNVRVAYNSAEDGGGGLAATAGASFEMERAPSCTLGIRCSEIVGNGIFATAVNGSGGGLAAWAGGVIEARQTHFELNSADGEGRVGWIAGASSRLEIEGGVVRNNLSNSVPEVFRVDDGATALFGFTTFADNLQSGSQVLVRASAGAVAGLYSSLVADDVGEIFGGSGAILDADCILAHEVASLPPGATRIGPATAQELLIREPSGLDVHLTATSPAIDFCTDSVWSPEAPDLDGEDRGVDRPSAPSTYGLFDLGADEAHDDPGLIFGDGFESGATSSWSG